MGEQDLEPDLDPRDHQSDLNVGDGNASDHFSSPTRMVAESSISAKPYD